MVDGRLAGLTPAAVTATIGDRPAGGLRALANGLRALANAWMCWVIAGLSPHIMRGHNRSRSGENPSVRFKPEARGKAGHPRSRRNFVQKLMPRLRSGI
jgi:hypothetical protein